ncbi:MAG: hypothetical protein J5639_03515 [Bacteroidales bacterium]|nr:hypothetical protein [Bacteroidales bacterium]
MEAKDKSMYVSPATEVVEIKTDGVICGTSDGATRSIYGESQSIGGTGYDED